MITNTKKKKKNKHGEWEKKTSMPTSHGTYINMGFNGKMHIHIESKGAYNE